MTSLHESCHDAIPYSSQLTYKDAAVCAGSGQAAWTPYSARSGDRGVLEGEGGGALGMGDSCSHGLEGDNERMSDLTTRKYCHYRLRSLTMKTTTAITAS